MSTLISAPVPISFEADARQSRRRLGKAREEEVEGMRLGPRPFITAARIYTERRHGIVAISTETEEKRKYKYLGRIFTTLKEEGKINTTDPRHMARNEIQEFMAWMRGQHIDVSAQEKYLQLVNNLLKAFKNFIIEEMKADWVRFPKASKKPVRVIQEDNLNSIFEAASRMPRWSGSMARGMISMYYATGMRPSELRQAHLVDLDLKRMVFFVRYPKGDGSWASPQEIDIIRPDMVPLIQKFLEERLEHLRSYGLKEATPLFPSIRGKKGAKKVGVYSANGFRQIKAKVEAESGVKFRLKDFRSTLTSATVNGDLSRLPAMSAQLRHTSVTTTQRSYFLMEKGAAGRQLKDAWKERPIAACSQTPSIKNNFPEAGYG